MKALRTIKDLAIRTGLYSAARGVKRRLDSKEREQHIQRRELYRSLIKPASLCFDVGANIGAVSEVLLEVGARVVAFEPNPTAIPELKARCGKSPNWSCVATAIGERDEIAVLYDRRSSGQASLDPNWEGEIVGTHHVPVITLEAAIRRFGMPEYCKIDVEGYELQVLRGLSRPIPLMSLEFHLNERNIAATVACMERLAGFGPALVNVTPAEASAFHFKEWRDIREFTDWFPRELERDMIGPGYGDLFVSVGTPPAAR